MNAGDLNIVLSDSQTHTVTDKSQSQTKSPVVKEKPAEKKKPAEKEKKLAEKEKPAEKEKKPVEEKKKPAEKEKPAQLPNTRRGPDFEQNREDAEFCKFYQAMRVKPWPDKRMSKIIESLDDYKAHLKNTKWLCVVYPKSDVTKLNLGKTFKDDIIPRDQVLPKVRDTQ